jgi:hypothetical protein
MKHNYFFIITVFVFCFSVSSSLAQEVKISGELRPRYEMRHGYKTLIPDDTKAANFVSQRTRLNAFYGNSNFKIYLSIQDVRVWGDVSQLNKSDVYGLSIHEAWGEAIVSDKFSIKVGRQEIIYDDHRIFGSVGWAQQARSHDAAILKFKPTDKHKVDVGLAYNANGESLFKTDYTVNSYKTFQYAWYHGSFDKIGLSFLVLNNGLAYMDNSDSSNIEQKVAFSQTIGPRVTYKADKLAANGAFYYQGGKNGKNNSLSAFYFAADASYKISAKFNIGLGFEYLSGTDTKDQGGDDKSFMPLYGTNHKFNGWMDYFYVGSHKGDVGLTDIYLPFKFKKDKFFAVLIPHYFLSAAKVSQIQEDGSLKEFSNGLGTEIDLVLGYTISKEVKLMAGYSQMIATETMQVLKGGNYKNSNNWAWVMLTFKPTFYKN